MVVLKSVDKSTKTLDFALGGYGNNLINNFIPFIGHDFISLTGNSYVKASIYCRLRNFQKTSHYARRQLGQHRRRYF